MNQHRALHSHKCKVCGMLFSYEESLKRHMTSHGRVDEESDEEEEATTGYGRRVSEEQTTSKDGVSDESHSESEQDHESDGDDNSDSNREDRFTYDNVKAILRYYQLKHSN